jgi:hypothetical protein
LAGCATSPHQRIVDAGTERGRAEAAIKLPDWPAWCRQPVPHATLAVGANAVSVLARERGQLDFANQRAGNCGAEYDRIKAGLEALH